MRFQWLFVLLLGCLPVLVWAKKIDAVMSHTYFFLPDAQKQGVMDPYIELYWQVNPHTVNFFTNSDKDIVARFNVNIEIWNEDKLLKADNYDYETAPRKDVKGLSALNIIDLKRYMIQYGLTTIKLTLTDSRDSLNIYSETDTFSLKEPAKKMFFSEPELIDTIIVSDANTPFRKNGKQKIPHCLNFLDDNYHLLHYYSELYGADQVPKIEYPLVKKVFISTRSNSTPLGNQYTYTDTINSEPMLVSSGNFNIEELRSGNYYLVTTVENKIHQVIATNYYFFQRMNTHPKIDTAKKEIMADTSAESVKVLDLNKTFVAKYDLGKIKAILKMMLPISDVLETNTINGFLKNPDEMYMRYYVYNYFSSRNAKDPAKAWREYSERVIACNSRFNYRTSPGYESDRGFIFLRYGEPTEILTVENEMGARPYELWQYNKLTQTNQKEIVNAVFLFYKTSDIADFRLLHSTVDGEVQNLAWRSFLYTNPGNSSGFTSKAEELIGSR